MIQSWLSSFLQERSLYSARLSAGRKLSVYCSSAVKVRKVDAFTANPIGLIYGGNPLLHVDYPSLEHVFESKVRKWLQQRAATRHFEPGQLIDILNVWIPTKQVENWNLGFVKAGSMGNSRQCVKVQFCSQYISLAASSRCLRSGVRLLYAGGLNWGQAWVFKSGFEARQKNISNISFVNAPFHSSFLLGVQSGSRHSAELRCAVLQS